MPENVTGSQPLENLKKPLQTLARRDIIPLCLPTKKREEPFLSTLLCRDFRLSQGADCCGHAGLYLHGEKGSYAMQKQGKRVRSTNVIERRSRDIRGRTHPIRDVRDRTEIVRS